MRYFFIFGNHPRLALAELATVLENVRFLFEGAYAIVESEGELDLPELQGRLGGVVKCGVVLKNTSRASFFDDAYQRIRETARGDEKFFFGISAYGVSLPVFDMGLSLKKLLKDEGFASRLVTSKNATLSSVVVKTNKLITEQGIEFVIMGNKDELLLCETRAVQPFAEFSARDYGRPARDAKSGMLPSKLARTMINLACLPVGMARVPKDETILDPFCGSGTILQEALLTGYAHVIGSDVSDQAIVATKKNLAWLSSITPTERFASAKLITADARSIHTNLSPHSVDAIVTEPYLGPPQTGRESQRDLEHTVLELEKLYDSALKAFHGILKPSGRVVIIFPIIRNMRLSLPSRFQSLRFMRDPAFETFYDDASRGSFVYQRPGQKVRREIFIIQKI